MYIYTYEYMNVYECEQMFMQGIVLSALSWASQHQARAMYSNKHHVASHKTR